MKANSLVWHFFFCYSDEPSVWGEVLSAVLVLVRLLSLSLARPFLSVHFIIAQVGACSDFKTVLRCFESTHIHWLIIEFEMTNEFVGSSLH